MRSWFEGSYCGARKIRVPPKGVNPPFVRRDATGTSWLSADYGLSYREGMKTKSKKGALKVKSSVKGGRISLNANRGPLKVRSGVKGGRLASNTNRRLLAK